MLPQMMPIWWTVISLLSMIMIMMMFISLFFFFMINNLKEKVNKLNKKMLMIDDL
uniref:ATP synthase F0 subunit 8 n=1 Tax=Anatoecus icterodes TaxID=1195957 RepID=UPI00211DE53C|nr:ATP synthase F0 subunit 8 [Anatoecus icterodes]UTT72532.1 ATP synthase F0 subunit 8 [Anatoecus icterodes]